MNPPAPSTQAHQSEANDRADLRERRRDRRRTAIGLTGLLLLGVLVVLVLRISSDRDQAVENTGSLAEQVLKACSEGGPAARQLEADGLCPHARALSEDPAQAAPQPEPPVFPEDQVRRIVADYLSENPPQNGRTPSAAEVDAAVVRVCASISCEGPAGADGTDGVDGEDAQDGRDGVDASPPSDDQLAAIVTQYCDAHNGCRPSAEEVAAAVEAYCLAEGERCRGRPGEPGGMPASYTRIETRNGPLGPVTTTLECTRTSEAEDTTPVYDCQEL